MTQDKIEGVVQRVDEVFTEESLAANDGKVVPLCLDTGGPVIGEATLKYVPEEKVLRADFRVDDPEMAEFLKQHPPSIFG